MKTLKKVAGVGAVGGIATGGYFVNDYFSIKNIEGQLRANNYEILDSNGEDWDSIILSYQEIVANNKDLMFEGFDGKQNIPQGKKAVDILKEKCQGIVKDEKKANKDYRKAEKWCIKPLTVSDKLRRLNLTPLDTNPQGKDDNNKWKERFNKHQSATKNQIEKLKVEGLEGKDIEEKIRVIKAACADLTTKKTYDRDFDNSLTVAKEWCAI